MVRLHDEPSVYYSFTISSAQCGKPVVPSHFNEVCAKRITPESINAFLTLTDVTKW
jgi:hypothetical protein